MADGAAVLVPVPVPPPVESVFDGRMATGQAKEGGFVGLLGFRTGEQEDGFLRDGAAAPFGPTVQAHGLSGEGKVHFGPVKRAAERGAFDIRGVCSA